MLFCCASLLVKCFSHIIAQHGNTFCESVILRSHFGIQILECPQTKTENYLKFNDGVLITHDLHASITIKKNTTTPQSFPKFRSLCSFPVFQPKTPHNFLTTVTAEGICGVFSTFFSPIVHNLLWNNFESILLLWFSHNRKRAF